MGEGQAYLLTYDQQSINLCTALHVDIVDHVYWKVQGRRASISSSSRTIRYHPITHLRERERETEGSAIAEIVHLPYLSSVLFTTCKRRVLGACNTSKYPYCLEVIDMSWGRS